MMRAAFSTWDNRIAPVFDVAGHIQIVEFSDNKISTRSSVSIDDDSPLQRVRTLVELGVNTLVCGAISRQLQTLISGYGIRVVPFVSGDLSDIMNAMLSGNVEISSFAMPGCCGRRRGKCALKSDSNQEVREMMKKNISGQGQGAGRGRSGQGRLGQKAGRMGGPAAAGTGGECVCNSCGYREPHKQGQPCYQRLCPNCDVALIRS